jgi:IS5 family transposase
VWHALSDPALEAQIRDRLSFRRFAGFSLTDRTPDHSTLWRFRDELTRKKLIEALFAAVNAQLEAKGLIVKQGTLVDATFMQAAARPPVKAKQDKESKTHEESKEGKTHEESKEGRPSADKDARWGRKGGKTVFGYKMHTGVDAKHTLIRKVEFTAASQTDTEPADRLISGDEKAVYGDMAYYTHKRHAQLKALKIKDRLMHRPNKHHLLSERQKKRNRMIAKVRAAVERPFAVFKQQYGMRRLRFFNRATNRTQCLLAACGYNLQRAASVLFPKGAPA